MIFSSAYSKSAIEHTFEFGTISDFSPSQFTIVSSSRAENSSELIQKESVIPSTWDLYNFLSSRQLDFEKINSTVSCCFEPKLSFWIIAQSIDSLFSSYYAVIFSAWNTLDSNVEAGKRLLLIICWRGVGCDRFSPVVELWHSIRRPIF